MKKILVCCMGLLALLAYAEDQAIMTERTTMPDAGAYNQESTLYSQNTETPFDVDEVIVKVQNRRKRDNNEMLLRESEFLLDSNIVYVSAQGPETNASVAFDGTYYLVVWDDMRVSSHYSYRDIYGTRVNQTGVILDSAGIAISTAPYDQRHPTVAFDGTNFLVAWDDTRNGNGSDLEDDIYIARVNQQGMMLDPDGIAISTAPYDQRYPEISFDGTNYLVVWQDNRNVSTTGYDIYGARVDQQGVVLDPDGIAISNATYNLQWEPSVAFDGINYLVVWANTPGAIYGARVNQQGIVLDPDGIAISTAANWRFSPCVTFAGNNYLVVWQDGRSGNYDIYGARVNQEGMVLDTNGIAITTAAQGQMHEPPSVISDGTNYLVVWDDYRNTDSTYVDIYGARVNQEGLVLEPNGIAIANAIGGQFYPAVGFDGSNFLCVWQDDRDSWGTNIYGTRIEQSGVVIDTNSILFSTAAYDQKHSSIAFDGTNFLVVWRDNRNLASTSYDIYGARVDQQGVVLDPDGIAISTAIAEQVNPAIAAFDGTNYLVVWQDNRNTSTTGYDIYGARVDQQGVVLDPDGIIICGEPGNERFPSISCDNTNYLVVWEKYPDHIYGTRVDQMGTILDPGGFAISPMGYQACYPVIAFDGTNYLVVWHGILQNATDISGCRVDQEAVVLDTNGIPISTAGAAQAWPSVAFDGTNYFVVWIDLRNASETRRDIYGARVSQYGVVLDPNGIAICSDSSEQWDPAITYGGSNYFVAWADRRNLTFFEYDIYGASVNTSGQITDTFNISVQLGEQCFPSLAHGVDNQVFVTYSGWTDSINSYPAHTVRIWGKLYPDFGIEETTSHTTLDISGLLQAYPNPFNDKLHIAYSMEQSAENMELKIYDATGRLVRNFPFHRSPIHHITWSGENNSGHRLPAGIYFVQIEADGYTEREKVIFLK